jgi:hypothetical protein
MFHQVRRRGGVIDVGIGNHRDQIADGVLPADGQFQVDFRGGLGVMLDEGVILTRPIDRLMETGQIVIGQYDLTTEISTKNKPSSGGQSG